MSTKSLRFWTTNPVAIEPGADWAAGARQLEDMGIDAVVMPDHFTGGWGVEPMVAMAAIAARTDRLRLATAVLGNDYRHPVQTHRMAATLDAVSGGRLVLGMGAGWLASDYEAAQIPMDPPAVRLERLAEAVEIVTALFGPDPVDHHGRHYAIRGLVGTPATTQQPHPPIMLGGGRPVALRLAGRVADIVGINTNTAAGHSGQHSIVDLSEESVAQKVRWVGEGLAESGRTFDDIELHGLCWLVRVTATASEADDVLRKVADRNGVPVDLLERSPGVLIGTVDAICDKLVERRETFGFSIVQLDAGFPLPRLTELQPVLDRLA